MKFEPTYLERSYCFVIPSFAQYFNEQVAKIYFHLHVNKAFPQALNSFDMDNMCFLFFCCVFFVLDEPPKNKDSSPLTA